MDLIKNHDKYIKDSYLYIKNINNALIDIFNTELLYQRGRYDDKEFIIIGYGDLTDKNEHRFPIKSFKFLLPDNYENVKILPNKHINKYLSNENVPLGTGVYGKVVKSGNFAIKTFFNSTDIKDINYSRNPYLEVSLLREVATLIHLDHENIIKLIDVVDGDPEDISKNVVSIILPLADYNLINYYKKFDNDYRRIIAYQILKGFAYIHEHDIIHGDVKPDNILINVLQNGYPHVLISDFGLSTPTNCVENSKKEKNYNIFFRAPEVQFNLGYQLSADIWAVGCLLYYVYTKNYLFYNKIVQEHSTDERLGYLVYIEIFSTLGYPVKYKKLYDVLEKEYLNINPNIKPLIGKSLEQLETNVDNYPMFEIILDMLKYDPYERLSFRDALDNPLFEINRQSDIFGKIGQLGCPGIVDSRQKYQIVSSTTDQIRINVSNKIALRLNQFKYNILDYFEIMYIFDYAYPGNFLRSPIGEEEYIFILACAEIYYKYKYNYYFFGIIKATEDIEYWDTVDRTIKLILKIIGFDLIVSTVGTFISSKQFELGKMSVEKKLTYKYLPKDIASSINIYSTKEYQILTELLR